MTIAWLAPAFLWLKAVHVIAVISWLAALLYLPRLYVYHCQTVPGSRESERFKLMEARLYGRIGTPAMIGTWAFGILLVLTPGAINWHAGWWHVKLLCVLLLSAFHGMLGGWRKGFLADANPRREGFYRIVNEIPTVLLVIIVVMVIVKPF
ncbi:MAG: protoporphyrinogen oxidase HemJ [Acetobacteraceae bacterium]